jgi:hypothetical protein
MFVATTTPLEGATWALVVATALLFGATAIPAITSVIEVYAKRHRRAAEVIPDMHMLRSRINGLIAHLQTDGSVSASLVDGYVKDLDEQLDMLARVIRHAPKQGMKFTNELYICRHLMTQAKHEIERASSHAKRNKDDRGLALVSRIELQRALHSSAAAKTSIAAAEELLPRRARMIDGETFWDRFSRLSHEREQGAEQQLMREGGS